MGGLYTGTVLVGLNRRDYAVLAADRLAVDCEKALDDPDRSRLIKKIAVHPSLPLAIAVSGAGSIESEAEEAREVFLTEVLEGIFSGLKGRGDVNVANIESLLAAELLPDLVAQKRRREGRGLDAPPTNLLVALHNGVKAVLVRLKLDGTITYQWPPSSNSGLFIPPRTLEGSDILRSSGLRSEYARGSKSASPEELASHARRLARWIMDQEARTCEPHEVSCGGGIDAVAVDDRGARLV